MSERFIIDQVRVLRVYEAVTKIWKGGIGKEAIFEDKSRGWYASLEGSYESIFLGMKKPKLQAGELVKVTLEKVEPKSCQPQSSGGSPPPTNTASSQSANLSAEPPRNVSSDQCLPQSHPALLGPDGKLFPVLPPDED